MKNEYKISIVAADDRPVVLCGLQSWFEAHERFRVTAGVTNGGQLLATLKAASYDLIVLSGAQEGSRADDFALLRELRRSFPETPVVIITGETDARALFHMLDAGASGLGSPRENADVFERLCERALSGAQRIVTPHIASYCSAPGAPVSFDAAADYGRVRVSVRQFIGR
ncbi:two-component system, response regulator [Caballeronia novacaledonica]|uniref:Two-component system, response regulator n=1 Tax=Caballeronia novacaledonica TaxID=1544861 RepID=A0A2U3I5C1_9BURK|nr:response regulator [Caballeronia novacaledonica]SPB15345.1 two-component system, response regulator [Caballeronia novacaledonica]